MTGDELMAAAQAEKSILLALLFAASLRAGNLTRS